MLDIQAIVLDVDGVIIGEKIGFNSPSPHIEVIDAMRYIQNSGIPIILCTAKPSFAIQKIVKDANLDNLHITDGGGVVIDPLRGVILSKHLIPPNIAKVIVEALLSANVYTEIYTTSEYIIDHSQSGEFTAKHKLVLQSSPREVESLINELQKVEVVKIMPIAKDLGDKIVVDQLLHQFLPSVVVSWGVHPVILPLQFGIVTAPGISKAIALSEILKKLKINLENVMGVGDSASDWQFIQSCGFAVAMGNAHEELKSLVSSRGSERSFIAPSVEVNGIIDTFKHFHLIA